MPVINIVVFDINGRLYSMRLWKRMLFIFCKLVHDFSVTSLRRKRYALHVVYSRDKSVVLQSIRIYRNMRFVWCVLWQQFLKWMTFVMRWIFYPQPSVRVENPPCRGTDILRNLPEYNTDSTGYKYIRMAVFKQICLLNFPGRAGLHWRCLLITERLSWKICRM